MDMIRLNKIARQLVGLPGGISDLINLRASYRDKGDYERADRIRDSLKSAGIGILDGKNGSDWRRL